MRFTTRTDISAPVEYVFEEFSGFERFERVALRRGAKVNRSDSSKAVGLQWEVEVDYRGRLRVIFVELTSFDAPNGLVAAFRSGGIQGTMTVDLVSLSKWRTRIGVDLDLKPQTMSARLLVQTLRLNKRRLKERFENRVLEFAQDIETGYRGLSG
jgi:hypothetical protein